MAIPSGGGTEVLKVGYESAVSNTDITLVTAGTHEIVTVLSIIYCEMAGAASKVLMYIDAGRTDLSGTSAVNVYLLYQQDLGIHETFVWNDKFVLYGGDVLKTSLHTSGTCCATISYIVQDWT